MMMPPLLIFRRVTLIRRRLRHYYAVIRRRCFTIFFRRYACRHAFHAYRVADSIFAAADAFMLPLIECAAVGQYAMRAALAIRYFAYAAR